MNVLQINKFYYPEVGGIEQVVRTLAEGLAEREHDCRVLASTPRGRGGFDRVKGVPVHRTASFGVAKSVPLAPTFPIRLQQMNRDADVVHHHLPNPLSAVSHLALGHSDTTTVVTYHSDIVRQTTALRLYRPALYRFLDTIDHIFVTSPRLLESSEHLSPYRDKTSVVPLSIDIDEFDAHRENRSDSPINDDRPTVLFVGRLNYYKGVEYLVDAMQSVDAQLLVVGEGNRRSELDSRVADRGLADRVTFLGRVSEEELHHCYERADLFVLPSVEPSEAFGIVQLEAMAYRTPVVNTDLPTGVPWVSKHGETGLTVPPRDADALAESINVLLDDEERRKRFGENARRRVEECFTRDRMINDTEKRYESLLRDTS